MIVLTFLPIDPLTAFIYHQHIKLGFGPVLKRSMRPVKITLPLEEIEITFSRSSGAGGQNVNKVNTKVTLHWDLNATTFFSDDTLCRFQKLWKGRINSDGHLFLHCEKFRSQFRNREEILKKLKDMIQKSFEKPKARIKTKPSRKSKEKRLKSKKERSEVKEGRRPVSW